MRDIDGTFIMDKYPEVSDSKWKEIEELFLQARKGVIIVSNVDYWDVAIAANFYNF